MAAHKSPKIWGIKILQPGESASQFGQNVEVERRCACVWIRGGFTLVDIPDIHLLLKRRWYLDRDGRTAYVRYSGQQERFRLHVLIAGPKRDHRNRCGWDNRRGNLRECSTQENARNHGPSRGKRHSAYKGVTFDSTRLRYKAVIMVDGKTAWRGWFVSETEAAKAYDAKALHYFGEFAYVNFSLKAGGRLG